MKSCTLYIIRHGQTEWNVKRLIQGQRDIPLNEKGKSQAEAMKLKLIKIKFDAVYSSDLSRARKTAEIIASRKHLTLQTSKDLRERHFGKYQGVSFGHDINIVKLIDRLKKSDAEKNEIEDDESLMKRFIGFLKKITAVNLGKTVLIVTHAGPMRTFLVKLGYGTYENFTEGCIDNLAYIKLESDGTNFHIMETSGIKKIE